MPDLEAGRDLTPRHSVQRCSLLPQSHSPDDPDRKDIAAKSRERFKTPAVSQRVFHQILLLISPYQQNPVLRPRFQDNFHQNRITCPQRALNVTVGRVLRQINAHLLGSDSPQSIPLYPAAVSVAVRLLEPPIQFRGVESDPMVRQGHAQAADRATDPAQRFTAASDFLPGPLRIRLQVARRCCEY